MSDQTKEDLTKGVAARRNLVGGTDEDDDPEDTQQDEYLGRKEDKTIESDKIFKENNKAAEKLGKGTFEVAKKMATPAPTEEELRDDNEWNVDDNNQ